MGMAKIQMFVGQPRSLRTKYQCCWGMDPFVHKALRRGFGFQHGPGDRAAARSRANDTPAIRHGLGQVAKDPGPLKDVFGTRRTRRCCRIRENPRIDQKQIWQTHIRHYPCCGAYVAWVSRAHQDDSGVKVQSYFPVNGRDAGGI
jgi:hypothetical protein